MTARIISDMLRRYKIIYYILLGEPRAERYVKFHTDPYYLIRLIPAEGSNQVAPSYAINKEDFFMFQKLFDFFVVTLEDGSYAPTSAGNVALFVIIALLFIGMATFGGLKAKTRIKQLAFSAMAVTLAVVTSMFPLVSFPFGGSITLFSMFFICLIGYLYGAKAGIITGISYGFINLIMHPYVIHPVQLLLDYPIAFGCLGLAGLFASKKYGIMKGYLVGVFARYLCSSLSGYIFFASYAPKGWNSIVYTLVYNIGYMGPEVLLTIVFLVIPPIQNALKQVKRMAAE